jgi:hypothetical protein
MINYFVILERVRCKNQEKEREKKREKKERKIGLSEPN